MSNFVPLETIDRRSIIRGIALAITSAGMLDLDFATYESLHADERYAARMRQHADRIFHGKSGAEMQDPEWYGEESWPDDESES